MPTVSNVMYFHHPFLVIRMILSAQSIRKLCTVYDPMPMVMPYFERTKHNGMSFGLSSAGYDVRIAEKITIKPGKFVLASTIERFWMPKRILAQVADKSTWARRGLAVQNTIIEPGWNGYLTLELTNHGPKSLMTEIGDPIAQIVFFWLDEETEIPYSGKYQDQKAGPQQAIHEE